MKKASLALSTNAIVVLIIAITILGLALTFTRNIFGTLGENVAAVGQGSLLDNPPSYDEPMTLSRQEVDARIGRDVKLKVALFNVHNSNVNATLTLESCKQGTSDTTGNFTETIPGSVEVPINEDVVYSIVLGVADSTPLGTHVCTFKGELKTGTTVEKSFYQHLYINVK